MWESRWDRVTPKTGATPDISYTYSQVRPHPDHDSGCFVSLPKYFGATENGTVRGAAGELNLCVELKLRSRLQTQLGCFISTLMWRHTDGVTVRTHTSLTVRSHESGWKTFSFE